MNEELQDPMGSQDHLDPQVNVESVDKLDQLDLRVHRVDQESEVREESLDHQENKVHLETKEHPDQRVRLDCSFFCQNFFVPNIQCDFRPII